MRFQEWVHLTTRLSFSVFCIEIAAHYLLVSRFLLRPLRLEF
jgi:hypothetical protein